MKTHRVTVEIKVDLAACLRALVLLAYLTLIG